MSATRMVQSGAESTDPRPTAFRISMGRASLGLTCIEIDMLE